MTVKQSTERDDKAETVSGKKTYIIAKASSLGTMCFFAGKKYKSVCLLMNLRLKGKCLYIEQYFSQFFKDFVVNHKKKSQSDYKGN